jgi:tRNA (cmo5U34)-methyltransferase
LKQIGLIHRTELHLGHVDELPPEKSFDAVTLIGVLHHLRPGDEAKRAILGSLAVRLKPGAPLIVACKRS